MLACLYDAYALEAFYRVVVQVLGSQRLGPEGVPAGSYGLEEVDVCLAVHVEQQDSVDLLEECEVGVGLLGRGEDVVEAHVLLVAEHGAAHAVGGCPGVHPAAPYGCGEGGYGGLHGSLLEGDFADFAGVLVAFYGVVRAQSGELAAEADLLAAVDAEVHYFVPHAQAVEVGGPGGGAGQAVRAVACRFGGVEGDDAFEAFVLEVDHLSLAGSFQCAAHAEGIAPAAGGERQYCGQEEDCFLGHGAVCVFVSRQGNGGKVPALFPV